MLYELKRKNGSEFHNHYVGITTKNTYSYTCMYATTVPTARQVLKQPYLPNSFSIKKGINSALSLPEWNRRYKRGVECIFNVIW